MKANVCNLVAFGLTSLGYIVRCRLEQTKEVRPSMRLRSRSQSSWYNVVQGSSEMEESFAPSRRVSETNMQTARN